MRGVLTSLEDIHKNIELGIGLGYSIPSKIFWLDLDNYKIYRREPSEEKASRRVAMFHPYLNSNYLLMELLVDSTGDHHNSFTIRTGLITFSRLRLIR